MKGTSKVIMGATLAMVVILAIVLGLVLVLLAELYCSLLLRRKKQPRTTTTTTTNMAANDSSQFHHLQNQSAFPQPLRSFYAHGVLHAPRSFLFPAVHGKEDKVVDTEKQHSQLHRFFESETEELNTTPPRIGVMMSTSPPSPSFVSVSSPKPIEKVTLQSGGSTSGCNGGGGCGGEHVVYISNPIYANDASGPNGLDTPFETPDTSPSRLETGGSSGEDSMNQSIQSSPSSPSSPPNTPPLMPMKKLPAEACSVSLRDSRSLPTSGSDSNSNNGLSSSSSGSPCTSPSW
ncbi:hypothetical protein LOK49_LG03G01398 [Camellia lanceoleosa]|uniref:Uncharacterized protein n=1 Tax=Camellia lanceoleosa TaxID=1840588 RepID=A0ACC0I7W4_9ERIC|nr:hypothetical protein LOK49_LG03G01398 [Camellia lanceoleosa]